MQYKRRNKKQRKRYFYFGVPYVALTESASAGASTAIVIRDTQVSSPASFFKSMCHTWVDRPMCTGRATPVTQPDFTPRK